MIDEGVIKFRSEWQESGPLDNPEIGWLIQWRKPLLAAGLIGHCEDVDIGYGNLSVRIDDSNRFIISGTQTGHVADVDARHFALVTGYDIANNRVFSTGAVEASSESLTHAMLYELDSSTQAIVHAHHDGAWTNLCGELPTTRSDVAYGTPDMALEFRRLYAETDFPKSGVAIMAGHEGGLIAIGENLEEASLRMLDATS